MRVYLHIGTMKTGTTSIQEFLYLNRERLMAQGYLYPLAGMHPDRSFHNHNPLGLNPAKFAAALQAELQHAQAMAVIISAENLQWVRSRPEWIAVFRTFLEYLGFDSIKIIIYLRDVNDLFVSMCSQALRDGTPADYDRLRPQDNPKAMLLSDYQATLQNWGRVFGMQHLIVRLYERENLMGGCDLLRDFCRAAGLQWQDDYAIPKPQNERLNLLEMECLRRVNARLPGAVYDRHSLKHIIYTCMRRHFDLPDDPALRFAPPAEIYAAYAQAFLSSNEWVRCHFFGQRQQLFAPKDLSAYHENFELRNMRPEYWERIGAFCIEIAALTQGPAKDSGAALAAGVQEALHPL